ncbi:hypothetical protein FACS18945_2140 [Bacteroidia bacterium]|nr:hypothetical protein FACS18945_2140 [Bacteroidia bacterium]
MAGPIEPPILMSRLMTFVFASALAAVLVLILSIAQISPLTKTQIFFLTTSPRDTSEITIQKYTPDADNIHLYKINFVREYIRVRNDIFPNIDVMRRKWAADSEGQVYVWSAPDVYKAFIETRLWNAVMASGVEIAIRCSTEFQGGVIHRGTDATNKMDRYEAKFRYVCFYENDIIASDDYSVMVGVRFQDSVQFSSRISNPLGIYVAEYKILSNNGNPLDINVDLAGGSPEINYY